MEKLIDKSKELTTLLQELEIVTEAEKHKYVVKFEYKLGDDNVYSIYNNEEKKFVKYDKIDRVKSYFNVRNIKETDIYYHNL
jgi:nuclear transport factor 2 (NTF2) superfamily protein